MCSHRDPSGSPRPEPLVPGADDSLIQRVRRAAEADRLRGQSEILIENEPNIVGALAAGIDVVRLLVTPKTVAHPLAAQLEGTVPVSLVPDHVLALIFQRTRIPDVFALAKLPPRKRFRAFDDTCGDLVVIDGVEGPGNIGSIIRSAAAFEAGGVIVLDHKHNDLFRRGVTRATAGTMFTLPVTTAKTEDFLRFCRASGTPIVTTSSHTEDGDFENVLGSTQRYAFVLGSEARGCSPVIEAAADLRCRIPMSTRVESLNVSVAASVLLFARYRACTELVAKGPTLS